MSNDPTPRYVRGAWAMNAVLATMRQGGRTVATDVDYEAMEGISRILDALAGAPAEVVIVQDGTTAGQQTGVKIAAVSAVSRALAESPPPSNDVTGNTASDAANDTTGPAAKAA